MREKIYKVIEKGKPDNKWSLVYDSILFIAIIASLVPLAFKKQNIIFFIIDKITVTIFIIDYILRWITSDIRYNKKTILSFIKYPFTFMAIIDLITIIPSIVVFKNSVNSLKALRVLRVFRAMRYSKNFQTIGAVYKKSREALLIVIGLAVGYILATALIIFNVEPKSFETFFDAIYWATITLTTVGYGDIYPVTKLGQIITMLSSFLGIAIIALPAGIITAGYMDELKKNRK